MARITGQPLISVTIDERSLAEADRILRGIPGGAQRAISRALNRTVSSSRTLLSRTIARRHGVKVGDVRKRILTRKSNRNYLRARLDVSTHREPLINLGARQTDTGVVYRAFGTGKQRVLEHAFIARGPKRGTQVWLRSRYVLGVPKYIDWHGRRMEALYMQKGGSIADLIEPEDRQAVLQKSSNDLAKNIDDQVGVELRRWANK